MAVLVARADGNLSAAATWGVVDATSLLDSEANNTVLTNAYVESAGFTPGAITVDAIAVKILVRGAVPAGPQSVRLAQGGVLVAGTEVFINVSDVEARNGEQGWYLFKFAAPVLLVAATVYTLSAKTTSASMITIYRNATAGNWSRLLRTTTTGAPAAGDSMHVLGEWTAATVVATRTVTMDLTAATDFGDNTVANPPGFTIGKSGVVTWGTTAATNYILRVSQRVVIFRGGTMNMGTTGTPCPRNSSMELQLDSAVADGDYGLIVYGTLNTQGLSRTVGKNVVRCQLTADLAALGTTYTVDTDTGWLNTDDVALASTTQTPGQAETKALNANAGAGSMTSGVGAVNAHSGTSPTQAEVVLLTRNVRIHSNSTTLMAYVYFGGAAVVDCDWTAFRYLGATATGKRGIEVDVTSAGSLAMSFCSIREFDNHGIFIASTTADNFSIDNLTGYKVGHQASGHNGITVPSTTGINWSLSNIDLVSGNTAQGAGVQLATLGGQLTNIRCNSGGGDGLTIILLAANAESIHKVWSGFEMHSNSQAGISVDGLDIGTLSNVNLWRNNGGAAFGGLYVGTLVGELTFETGAFFGNSTQNVLFASAAGSRRLILRNIVLSGDSTFATASGVQLAGVNNTYSSLLIDNCTFGVASGIKVTHSTADINIGAASNRVAEIVLRNTLLSSGTKINNQAGMRGRSYIKYERVDQVTNVHKTVWPRLGTAAYETGTFRTAAPSQKLTPSGRGAGEKLQSGPKRKRIANGGTVAISVYVRKNAGYTGNAPRLMQRVNSAIGVLTDTVIATHSAAADTWQQLSGTTAAATENGVAEFFVDCDGAAGDVFVDDWS